MLRNKIIKRILIVVFLIFLINITACESTENNHVYESRGNTVVLLYHTLVATDEEINEISSDSYGIITTAEKFEKDIADMLSYGYISISLNDLYDNKNDIENKYFAVTFDDGYLSNYEIAYPILKKLNCYADIFINTDNEYMEHHFSFGQAKEMEKSGLITIHSHFPAHVDVREYSNEDFSRELNKSFDILNEKLGKRKYRFFSYPYGFYDLEKYETAKNSGVALQFIQEPSESGEGDFIIFIIRRSMAYKTDIARMLETVYMN